MRTHVAIELTYCMIFIACGTGIYYRYLLVLGFEFASLGFRLRLDLESGVGLVLQF